jgi:hypothetical protein
MILTIAKIIVIWTLASIIAAEIYALLCIRRDQRPSCCKPDEFRREREMLSLADSECADWIDPLIHGELFK